MTTYYVDPTVGNDANPGHTPSLPWKTVSKVRAEAYGGSIKSGDSILFRCLPEGREPLAIMRVFADYAIPDMDDWEPIPGKVWSARPITK
jgi:hypothetical protein